MLPGEQHTSSGEPQTHGFGSPKTKVNKVEVCWGIYVAVSGNLIIYQRLSTLMPSQLNIWEIKMTTRTRVGKGLCNFIHFQSFFGSVWGPDFRNYLGIKTRDMSNLDSKPNFGNWGKGSENTTFIWYEKAGWCFRYGKLTWL